MCSVVVMVMTKVARAMVGSVREAVGNCLVELDDMAGVPMQGWRTGQQGAKIHKVQETSLD